MEKYYQNTFLDLNTSINKDVAISILLGLRSVDPVRPDANHQDDPQAEYEKYVNGLDISIFDIISNMRYSAQMGVEDAIENKDQEEKAKCKNEVMQCDDLIRNAHRYLCDINYELSKGDQSILKVDRATTTNTDNPYIEISSLDEWVKQKYEVSFLSIKPYKPSTDSSKSLNLDDTDEGQDESFQDGAIGKTKADNLYVTLAFLVEVYSKTQTRYRVGEDPNVSEIAKMLSDFAEKAKKGISGQSYESIRKHITEALRRKEAKLAGR